ncbi:Putative thiamine pyrophosphate-containing protein YdaP [Jannaschia seosinensis]|uniref:Putative thiamine pyrophosphate-containing protein YdaP n=1 Tax=Jannaschia seosinensis TaxID=313367 RepID=A0A0M7BHH7_9RHOB|nr:thiamine pyrophosphate-requiring protein [Jannaschia seosinensis]CUH40806.1 Putative thiamine pyrophosphate-containing protein YdaP [Jannaschia seosinensis]
MADTVADFLLKRLKEWEIRRIYGFPGDGINGIVGAMETGLDENLEFVQTRHEEEAAFMACGHAKWTGDVGVCLATSGPGAIHLLNGLYDAKLDHQPVLAIVGQQSRAAMGGHYQQEVDLMSLFKDVAGDFVQTCMAPQQMRHLIDRALRIAKAERTVTCLIIPNDVQEMPHEEPPQEHGTIHSGIGYAQPRIVPGEEQLREAAEVLNSGKKVAMLVGAGALNATDEVIETAEVLGAGVAKALLGRAAVPDDLPFVTGQIGLLGTRPSWDMMKDCDTLLMVGSGFPYSEFLPEEGQARGVQIDLDPKMLSIRYPMDTNLVGDAALTLRALLPYLKRKEDRSWRESLEGKITDWWEGERERAHLSADPINPELLFWEASDRLPDNAIVSADSGSSANWFARGMKFRRGQMASLSGTLATMCPGVPYATAAKFCHPDRVAIGFVGDGAMQMLGMSSLITAAKYWQQWQDPRMVICVLNNGDLNQVTWELRAMGGFPKVEETQNVPQLNYAQYAELLGLRGIRVDRPEQVGPAWDEALRADRPVVIDAVVDPNMASLPPHITYSQAKSFAKSLLKGDPDSYAIVKQSIKRSWA